MTKLHSIALIIVLLCFLLASAALLTRGHDWGDDFALYIRQAESIVTGTEGHFIAQNVYTNLNSSRVFGPNEGPWGYPLFLAFFYRIFGLNPIGLKVSNVISLLLFLLFFFLLIKDRLPPLEAILVTAVLAFSPQIIIAQNELLTDLPNLALSILAIVLMASSVLPGGTRGFSSLWRNIVLGVVIFLAFFIRLDGAFLLVTLLACQIVYVLQHRSERIDFKRAILDFALPYLVFVALWGISTLVFPSGKEYETLALQTSQSSLTLGTVARNFYHYFHLIDQSFLIGVPSAGIVYGILLAFFVVGVLARAQQDFAFLIYSFLNVALVLILPYTAGIRYLFPALPFFVYFCFQGTRIAFSGLEGRVRAVGLAVTYLFWTGILVLFVSTTLQLAGSNLAAGRQTPGPFDGPSTEMFDFIRTETSPDSVIVFFKPRAMLLFTDRNSIMINQCAQLNRGDYAVLEKDGSPDQVSPGTIESCGLTLQHVFENDNFIAYRIAH